MILILLLLLSWPAGLIEASGSAELMESSTVSEGEGDTLEYPGDLGGEATKNVVDTIELQ